MQQKQNCGHPLRRKGSISRVSKVTCGLLFCLTTGVFAAGENVELLTSDRIENAVPDQVGKTVTIMVQDEMGPVAGANVVVKGTRTEISRIWTERSFCRMFPITRR